MRGGDRSRGVDRAESRWDSGEGSRVRGVGSRGAVCANGARARGTGGEFRREVWPEDLSATGGGEGERRLQVMDVGPRMTFSRRGLLDRALQSPDRGPVGGDLLPGGGDLARKGGRLFNGDLDLDLRL